MRSQSAVPLKKSAACGREPSAPAPADSTACGHFDGVILSREQPRRILAVTASGGRLRRLAPQCARLRSGSRNKYEPLWAFADVLHRAAEVDIDDADLIFVGQSLADFGQRFRVVVPHLHRQRPRLVLHAPEPIGMLGFVLVHPDEAAGGNHLGRLQARAAKFAHDLPKGIVRKARHRRLQNRRIDQQRADSQKPPNRWSAVIAPLLDEGGIVIGGIRIFVILPCSRQVSKGWIDCGEFNYSLAKTHMKTSLQPGLKAEIQHRVVSQELLSTVYPGGPPVFATPFLLGLMEHAAAGAVQSHLDEGEASVGYGFEFHHLCALRLCAM